MNIRLLSLVGVAVLVVAGVLYLTLGPEGSERQGGRGASRAGGMRLPVVGMIATPQPFDNAIVASGTVLASEEVELRSEVAGKVIALPFREGARVKKGDLLVKINDADLRAQLLRARSRFDLATQREDRQKKLREVNGVSADQYDEARNELTAAGAEVALLEANLQKTEVRAPFDGIVGLRFISEGGFISSATLVARLQDMSFVKIDFSVPEKYAPQVRVGVEITFTIDGTSEIFRGTVYAVEPKIDPATRSLRVRARSANESGRILPGSYTKVRLVLHRQSDAILIPSQALMPDLDGQKVFLARGGVARLVRIETGMRTEGLVQIVSGIQHADTVLTTGLLQLREGSPIQVTIQN
ncbi:MAG: efflux RND transporter periplasmic adaptor subunit [Bacteroidetes bacterium]|jgi:membrane fusion protein (multidrug efflux system)|nr:efflux RND transporter periplasmic adaptor subunit [Bacteroidota bacterium]